MNSCELVAAITAVAISIANCLNDDDLQIAGVVFSQLGDTLSTISTKRSICNNLSAKNTSDTLPPAKDTSDGLPAEDANDASPTEDTNNPPPLTAEADSDDVSQTLPE